MEKRKVILSKDAVLWEAGDPARTLAVVEAGKLGIRVEKALVGVVGANMVVGESALLLLLDKEQPRRTATVFALEEGTTVVEYAPILVKQTLDEQAHSIWRAILTTLLGQIWRNCLLLVSAGRESPFFSQPFRSLMQSLVQTYKVQIQVVHSWEEFSTTFRFLFGTRDYTEAMRRELLGPRTDKDAVIRASAVAQEFLEGHGDLPFLTEVLNAERERSDWVERFELAR